MAKRSKTEKVGAPISTNVSKKRPKLDIREEEEEKNDDDDDDDDDDDGDDEAKKGQEAKQRVRSVHFTPTVLTRSPRD